MHLSALAPTTWRADAPSTILAPVLVRNWSSIIPAFGGHGDGDSEGELQNWSSLIGIITAICGNILIALALNVQRYAHIRLHRQKAEIRERARRALKDAAKRQGSGSGSGSSYGTAGPSTEGMNGSASKQNGGQQTDGARGSHETEPLARSFRSGDSGWTEDSSDDEPKAVSTYLKDPYWWMGQVLITVGEMGNFLAYGFAPASIVSPLGVVALVSNCVIAPLFFNEVFRPRDFWGVIIAVGGAVTVVLSAKQEETKLGPHEVWDAITTMEFKIYMGVSCSLIALLMWLSPKYGNRTILIDMGLVGLFGGYTALSTKGVSSMLSSTLFGAFATPVTYVLLFVLLFTAVMQVRYINKALARFDSTQVIPIQFVSFTLCVIIGSAVLYRDFERTTGEQAVKFVGGCLLTFFGVFLITSGRPPHDEEDETLSDAEGIEETINLFEQGPAAAHATHQTFRRGSASTTSRRSSHASRVSFADSVNRPLAAIAGTGFPSSRAPTQPPASKPPPQAGDSGEDSPWIDEPATPTHPGAGLHTISADSVPSIASNAVSDTEAQHDPHKPQIHLPTNTNTPIERPVTPPRAPLSSSRPHSHHFVISPSPFSSTVTAVVADKLLAHMDSPTSRRGIGSKRSRPGLRNSLFVPQDETSDGEDDLESGPATRMASAVERRPADAALFTDDVLPEASEAEGKKSVRGRARSLSHTLGELFGVGRGRRNIGEGSDGETERLLGRDGAGSE
ncbi:magnesium transporter NIPA-domain-containing protein [Podospora aff. communis PSN243]|uniref:Magnesium transporter NIPA-domain-containing protein n=1 Tax=Podospora aff. communis PSN243 TaxID=3040156 RepID=A0AAV9HA68_9PEZI|nr:magnesium transporter NIPA-domain-containing protein [Podospora aff. communis PSN243]